MLTTFKIDNNALIVPSAIVREIARLVANGEIGAGVRDGYCEYLQETHAMTWPLDSYSRAYLKALSFWSTHRLPEPDAGPGVAKVWHSGVFVAVRVTMRPSVEALRVQVWMRRVKEPAYPEAILLRGLEAA